MTAFDSHRAVGRKKIRIEKISDERNRQARHPAMHAMHGKMKALLPQRLLHVTATVICVPAPLMASSRPHQSSRFPL